MSRDVTIEINGLDQILKALKAKPPSARVGILGGRDNRQIEDQAGSGGSSPIGNAEIGAAHEFGTTSVPKRSFLLEPLMDNLIKRTEGSGLTDKDTLAKVIKDGSVVPWVKEVTALAEKVVLEAFDTGGFGKWPALKPETLAHKKNHQILVETQQLRGAITSEVKE